MRRGRILFLAFAVFIILYKSLIQNVSVVSSQFNFELRKEIVQAVNEALMSPYLIKTQNFSLRNVRLIDSDVKDNKVILNLSREILDLRLGSEEFEQVLHQIHFKVGEDIYGQMRNAEYFGGTDNIPPTISAFSVTPLSVILGTPFTIYYTVSDAGGSGLERVEFFLARDGNNNNTPDPGEWKEFYYNSLLGAGDGPVSGSLSNTPSLPGTYWYGIHAVDNAGNRTYEPNPPGPLRVTVTDADTTPDPFTFVDQTGVELNTVVTSNVITVTGINAAAPISITGGTYAINGGAYTSSSGTVNNGNTVTVRVTSSGSYSTTVNAKLTIGEVSDTFSVMTRAAPPDTTPPTVPGSFLASAVSSMQINLSWTASTDTGGSGLAGYKVERCTGSGCTGFSQIKTTTATSYSDPGLDANTTYTYRLRAYDNAGNHSSYSDIAYDTTQVPRDTNIDIYIGGVKRGSYSIPPGGRVTPQYAGVIDGPVRVVSTNGVPIFASERTVYGDSFNEVMGYPGDQLTTEYWFPWYDQVYMDTWILVGNPSTSETANVDIYIGGVKRGSYSIPAGGRVTPQYAGVIDGPVRVVSTNGVPIFASERTVYGDSFNEVMGYPGDQLTTEYWFPWYDQVYMRTWILVGNPSP